MLAGRRWSPRPRPPPLFTCTYSFASPATVSGGVYCPMGWQQYSRPLWLSRGNHYILYPNAITAQMRVCGLVFHKWRGLSGIGVMGRHFSCRRAGELMMIFLRGLNPLSGRLPRTYVLGYLSVAPSGLVSSRRLAFLHISLLRPQPGPRESGCVFITLRSFASA